MKALPSIRTSLFLVLAAAASVGPLTAWHVAKAASVTAPPKGPLKFVQDDYAKALAEARAKKSPLFIDFWAPW